MVLGFETLNLKLYELKISNGTSKQTCAMVTGSEAPGFETASRASSRAGATGVSQWLSCRPLYYTIPYYTILD